jgi:carbonic anhydrase
MHYRLLLPVLLAVVLIGCGGRPDAERNVEVDSTAWLAPDPDGPPAAWSYEGETGPAKWARLANEYAACDGNRQSPIALTGATTKTGHTFNAKYLMELGEVVDTGYAIQVNTTGGMIMYEGQMYGLQQFHAHTPAEHTVNGTTYPAEVHLVHRAQNGDLVILAVFVEEGDTSNPALQTWITGADTTMTFRPSRLFPKKQAYYTYRGSLTTPPCSETVRWLVMDTPISASAAQIDTLRAQHGGNARPVQPLGDRRLTHITP